MLWVLEFLAGGHEGPLHRRWVHGHPFAFVDILDRDGIAQRHVRVDRVVSCMVECGIEEFVYCWPLAKPISVLPPGVYDIYVPAQSAFPLDTGTGVEVTVLLEPVTDDFVTALGLSSCGSQPCCD